MLGDIRTHSNSTSILLRRSGTPSRSPSVKIRPYPRKWESAIMSQIPELTLRPTDQAPRCDVRHDAPAVVFSTGGYTGNVFHEFNEGIVPLYLTARHFDKHVVFVVLQYKNWWVTKYGDVLSRLSNFPPVDFFNDTRTHCFPEAIVGLRINGDLVADSGFRRLLDRAYRPRIRSLELEERIENDGSVVIVEQQKPKLVILSRTVSRVIENEEDLVKLAEDSGFYVEVLRPDRTTELAKAYRALNSSDAMLGVHGAAMTHFLLMRPGAVFIQIVPLGTNWAAETFYGEPAARMGLWYLGYKILPGESSLCREYEASDPVIRDPEGVNAKGWEETKRVYLVQNVTLDLGRFRKQLERAYWYLISKRRHNF